MLHRPVSQSAKIQAAKERLPSAERNGGASEVNLIHLACHNVLPHRLDTAANLDVLGARGLARLVQSSVGAISDKVKCRAASHLDWRSRIMRQHEGRRMIGRIAAPPALPLIVWPLSTNRSEHVSTEYEGAETLHRASGERIINASFPVSISVHLTKSPRWEKPLKQLLASQTKRMI